VSFFWLKYRYPNGQFAAAAVIEATSLVIARLEAAVFGLDDGLVFAGGYKIDDASARQIPESMIYRLLDPGDLHRLHQLWLTKKPLAPSVNGRQRRKRHRASDNEPPATSARRATALRRVRR
jgi:hypothetical protein